MDLCIHTRIHIHNHSHPPRHNALDVSSFNLFIYYY